MEDLDNNQFQPNQPHDVADDTVAPNDAENRANHDNDDIVHMMNNCEWTDEEKHKIVEIDIQERRRGKYFMRRVNERWDVEYPGTVRTAQNLIDNARRLKKEVWGRQAEIENQNEVEVQQQIGEQNRTSLERTTEIKIVLVMLDQEERANGRGFMKRVKERWDAKYPEYQSVSWQKLRDNAARFKKDPEIKDFILVRQREMIQMAENVIENNLVEERNIGEPAVRNDEEEQEGAGVDEAIGNIQIGVELTEKDKELEQYFIAGLEKLNHSTLLHMEPVEKLPKVTMNPEIQERSNKVLRMYLPSADTIPEITDIVYAMGKAAGYAMGERSKESNRNGVRKAEGGNRRERKLKAEMKKLRQDIARAGNELHRRKQQRKATKKEKEILRELKTNMNGKEVTPNNLKMAKEQWLDKLRYKKIKLVKFIEKRNKKKITSCFRKIRKAFFGPWRKLKSTKVKCLKWRSLLNSGEAFGSRMNRHQICHGWWK